MDTLSREGRQRVLKGHRNGMRELFFVQADVFTSEAFGGNQLAVFFDADGLEQKDIETLALEMNFSESTFIQKSTAAGCNARLRISLPGKEIPFAGHPTVGSAAVMHLRGLLPERAVLELGVGPVALEMTKLGERKAHAVMTQPRAELGQPLRVEADAARALGLARQDLDPHFPIRAAGRGFRFLLVPLATRDALARVQADAGALITLLKSAAGEGVYLYTLDSPDPGSLVSARMLMPIRGSILEDPATGSAAGPLAAHLAACGLEGARPGRKFTVRQGVEMGRPSSLECNVIGLPEANEGVKVGGEVVVVGEGKIFYEG